MALGITIYNRQTQTSKSGKQYIGSLLSKLAENSVTPRPIGRLFYDGRGVINLHASHFCVQLIDRQLAETDRFAVQCSTNVGSHVSTTTLRGLEAFLEVLNFRVEFIFNPPRS